MNNNADARNESTPRQLILTGELLDSDGNIVMDTDDSIDTIHYTGIIDSMKKHLKKHLLNCLEVSYGGDHGTGEASLEFECIPPMKFTLKSRNSASNSRRRNGFTRRNRGQLPARQFRMNFHASVV
jgi:hypothetical protein